MSPKPHGNAYVYDQLHRINQSKSFDNLNAATNEWGGGTTYQGMYENSFSSRTERSRSHDANGNILAQLRSDSEGKEIDSLTYRYSVGQYGLTRNRLYHVNDTVRASAFDDDIDNMGPFDPNPSGINVNNNYSYDELGQLLRDEQEGIAAIDWRNDGKIRNIFAPMMWPSHARPARRKGGSSVLTSPLTTERESHTGTAVRTAIA